VAKSVPGFFLIARRIVPRFFKQGLADLHDRILQDQAASVEPDY
jgi:hypothetical protein